MEFSIDINRDTSEPNSGEDWNVANMQLLLMGQYSNQDSVESILFRAQEGVLIRPVDISLNPVWLFLGYCETRERHNFFTELPLELSECIQISKSLSPLQI